MILLPLFFTTVMGFMIGGNRTSAPRKIPVWLVDEDGSAYSRLVADQLRSSSGLSLKEGSLDQAKSSVSKGASSAAVVLPSGLSEALSSGQTVEIRILSLSDISQLVAVEQAVRGAAARLASNAVAADYTVRALLEKGRAPAGDISVWQKAFDEADKTWEAGVPIAVKTEEALAGGQAPRGLTGMTQTSMGFTVAFVMFTLVLGAGSILEERKAGTWGRLLTTPTSKASILGGKLLGAYMTGVAQVLVLVLFGRFVLGVDWGRSVLGATLVLAAFLFAVTGLGLFMAGLVRTSAQLQAAAPIVITSTSMLGGAYWPLEIVSKPMQAAALLTPQGWAMEGLTALIARGADLTAVAAPVAVLIGFGILFFSLGLPRVRFE
jgi:ABC-2 type transport system permease protein